MRVFLLSILLLFGIAGSSYGQVTNCSGWITRDTTWTPLGAGDDNSSGAITLPFNFCWYGTNLTSVYVNNNGNISFGTPYGNYSAAGFPNGSFVMLAPFWADVDTRGAGGVYYKVYPNYMVVQWDGVGYYGAHTDKLNYFQIVISDGTSSLTPNGNVSYSYKDMQWTTGDASGGSGGFGGSSAVVGANKGDGVNYFQLGAFNTTGNTYNGSTTPSGVDWLDNQQFVFDACTPNSGNLPPIISGISRCDTLRLCVGDTLPVNLTGFGPEAAQNVSFTVTSPGVTGYTIVSNTSGTQAQLQSYFVGSTTNAGLNTIHIVAADNGTPAATTSMDINVLVLPLPTINTQPVTHTVCPGTNTTFGVAATGVSVGYQWQVSTGTGFSDLANGGVYSNVTTNTLGITAAASSMNGYKYRCVVKNSSGCFVISDSATLNLYSTPSISSEPTDTTICEDGNAAFAVSATGTAITYQWQVTSGSTYSNVPNTAPYSGVTTATLTLTGATATLNGNKYRCIVSGTCSPADTSNVAVLHTNLKPHIATQAHPDTTCNGSDAWFGITATGTNLVYQWQVNTGSGFSNVSNTAPYSGSNTDTLKITAATLALQGYQYRCIVSGTCAPPDTGIAAALRIDSLPVITAQPISGTLCSGENTTFSITAAGTNIIYQWQVNTGSGFTALSNSSIYNGATTNTLSVTGATFAMNGYSYRCVVTGKCSPVANSDSAILTVNPRPVTAFTANTNNQCLSGNSFAFTNTTTIAAGTVATYQWSFGDGATSTANSPSHTYTAAGTYTVKVVAASDHGCTDSTTHTVTVYPQPAVAFTAANSAQCLSGNNFSFTNNSSVSSGTLTYAWDFGDGATAITANATHAYTAAGTYTVKLVATTDHGCKDSLTSQVTVFNKPTAAFTINNTSQCFTGNNFSFTNTSAIAAGSLSYMWSFGDGATSTATNDTHTYTAAGSYTVKLVILSNSGCSDSVTQIVTVYPKPAVAFTTPNAAQCFSGNSFTFNNSSSVSSGSITYAWNFGDGATAITANAAHSYTAAGTYTVKLVVTTDHGCKDSSSTTVTVYTKPSPAFTVNNTGQCFTGNSFSFTNASTIATGVMTYTWNFGDGVTDTATNSSHIYTTAGTYTVKLIAVSGNGCADSVTHTVTVYPQPAVSFTTANNAQCVNGNSFSFINNSSVSSGTITYAWSFGDGATDTAKNVTHIYAAAGTYTVKLIATTGFGCKDSSTQTVTIYDKPLPAYTINNAGQCFSGNSFAFTNASTIATGTMTYQWSFGDGNTDTATSPVHAYTTAGTYTIKLVTLSNHGCMDSVTHTVTVYPAPVPAFAVNNAGQCVNNNNFAFANNSTIGSGSMSYSWTFGDGNSDTAAAPVHTYTTAGSYTVKLVATTDHGCKDSVTQVITVYPKPAPAYTINNIVQCFAGNSFTFTNTGTISSGTMTHSWDLGDGTSGNTVNATHVYTGAGTFQVMLTSTSNNGCTDTVSHTVTVKPTPNAPVTTPVTYCQYAPTVALTAPGTADLWYTAATGGTGTATAPVPSAAVPGSTTWYVTQTVNGCESARAAISDTIYAAPVATATAAGPVAFCNGDSVLFNANLGLGLSYQWNYNNGPISGASDSSYTARIGGAYAVTVTGDHHCQFTSPAITVTVHDLPDAFITYNTPIAFCQDGAVVLNADDGTGYTYQWYKDNAPMPGAVNDYYVAAQQGSYAVQVTNIYGCVRMSQAQVPVTIFPKPTPVIHMSGFDLYTDQYITYQWFLNTQAISNATQNNYYATQDGAYFVEVTDSNGCLQRSSVVFINNVGISQATVSSKEIHIYPNPTQGIVNIDAPVKVNYFITSVEGKILQSGEEVHSVDLTAFPNGMYMLNITDSENHLIKTEKVIKTGN